MSKKQTITNTLATYVRSRNAPILFAVILLVLGGIVYIARPKNTTNLIQPAGESNEIKMIKQTTVLKEQASYYRALLERVGAEEAQEQLLRSGLPFTGETHLLNHTAGDYIYEKYGIEGIAKCRDYFLGSCYHGLLLHVIRGDAEEDFDQVKNAIEHCVRAGSALVGQCSHGIGHGYVAAVGYAHLDTALEQCSKLAAGIPDLQVYNCYDGAFMENVWGVHGGEPSPDRWVKADDPIYPCNDPRLKPEHINPCWSNQPSLLYQYYGGDLKKVGETCLTVRPEDAKSTCFDGLSRQIHPITQNKPDEVFRLCANLPADWQNFCHISNVKAAFSVGDRSMPYEVCARIDQGAKAECYQSLSGIIAAYATSPDQKREWCNKIKDTDYRKSCM